jgi:hypothetical protein
VTPLINRTFFRLKPQTEESMSDANGLNKSDRKLKPHIGNPAHTISIFAIAKKRDLTCAK